MEIVGNESLTISHNAKAFESMFRRAPNVTMYQATTMIRRWFFRHRREVLEGLKNPKMRRAFRGQPSKGVPPWATFRVSPFGSVRSEFQLRSKIYNLKNPDLGRVFGRIRELSTVIIAHETGATVTPKGAGLLAVPVGKFARMSQTRRREMNLRSPKDYRAANGPDSLVFIPEGNALRGATNARGFGGDSPGVLARKTGKVLKSGREQIEVVWTLKRSVRIEPTLRLVQTWRSLGSYRDRTLQEHIGRIYAELDRFVAQNSGRIIARAS